MKRPMICKPQKHPIDLEALHEWIMQRYPKVMKRLREAELEEEK